MDMDVDSQTLDPRFYYPPAWQRLLAWILICGSVSCVALLTPSLASMAGMALFLCSLLLVWGIIKGGAVRVVARRGERLLLCAQLAVIVGLHAVVWAFYLS